MTSQERQAHPNALLSLEDWGNSGVHNDSGYILRLSPNDWLSEAGPCASCPPWVWTESYLKATELQGRAFSHSTTHCL